MNGISHSISGFGFQIEELFGKAFILINKEKIAIKPKVLEKEQSVLWTEIQKISYNLNKLYISKIDDSTLTFNLSEVDYTQKQKIKEIIQYIANEKQIITTL